MTKNRTTKHGWVVFAGRGVEMAAKFLKAGTTFTVTAKGQVLYRGADEMVAWEATNRAWAQAA